MPEGVTTGTRMGGDAVLATKRDNVTIYGSATVLPTWEAQILDHATVVTVTVAQSLSRYQERSVVKSVVLSKTDGSLTFFTIFGERTDFVLL